MAGARAHVSGLDDGLVSIAPLLERCGGRFSDMIDQPAAPERIAALLGAETIGRPIGSPPLDRLASAHRAREGRDPRPGRRGPKRN
jgi:hypothetical protein